LTCGISKLWQSNIVIILSITSIINKVTTQVPQIKN
jgi:hypothetical protein